MIKFFRHIRKSLLMENKTSKYFKYAIGEIVLVVIGILIALQINNWNEDRLRQLKEIEILSDFKRELGVDIKELQYVMPQYNRSKKSIENILYHLENDLPYNDALQTDFFHSTNIYDFVGFRTSVFETLKSSGIDLISNKDLRNSIIDVYDNKEPWLISWGERYIDLIFDAEQKIYNSRFKDFWNGDYKNPNVIGTMTPLNYESLKTDEEFKYHLRTQLNLIDWLVGKPVEEMQLATDRLMKLINLELDNATKK